jgi:RHS repeat-associated protein
MLTATKKEMFSAPMVWTDERVLPLAASGVYPKTRVWGSKPENVHCSSATSPLKIELRWGCEKSSEKTAVGSGVSFKYDPFGRRIEKISPTATNIFAYDGDKLVETVNASGGVVARYSQGLNIDEPLAELRSVTTSYYEADGLGSVTSLTNSSGAVAQTYTYDSFGNVTNSTGTLSNPFSYTGREFDSETGLYYYRARYYDPSAGRFLSEDRPNSTSNIHGFYQYASNNPLLWTDPTGLTLQGPPPVPVPGGGPGNGWKWNPDSLNPRGGTWGPREPIPGQGQPSASPEGDSHWDVDDGKGGRQRYDPDGNPITPQQAHPRSPCALNKKWFIVGAVVAAAVAIALAPVTGGGSLGALAAAF